MSNKTEYIHKEIPLEAVEHLIDGTAIVGRGADLCENRAAVKGFSGYSWRESIEGWCSTPILNSSSFRRRGYQLLAVPADDPIYRKIMEEERELPVKEWLKMLPKEYALRALKNLSDHPFPTKSKMETITAAIGQFNWSDSPEGFDFWDKVDDFFRYMRDSLPPIPEEEPAQPETYLQKVRERIQKQTGLSTVSLSFNLSDFGEETYEAIFEDETHVHLASGSSVDGLIEKIKERIEPSPEEKAAKAFRKRGPYIAEWEAVVGLIKSGQIPHVKFTPEEE